MRISELAQRTGLGVDTIRFYEKMGLLTEDHFTRRDNNYRDYSEAALERIEFVKAGRAAGFTLAEIASAADDWQANAISPEQKVAYFQQKMAEIDAQIVRLQGIRAYLDHKIAYFGALANGDACAEEMMPATGTTRR